MKNRFLAAARTMSALACVCTLLAAAPCRISADEETFAQAPFTYFAPVPGYRDPMLTTYGYLLSYRVGADYTQAVFHDGAHAQFDLVVGGNFTVEGQTIECMNAPSPEDSPSSVTCPDWPADIVLGRTPVKITYWMTRLGERPIAVLQSVEPYHPAGR